MKHPSLVEIVEPPPPEVVGVRLAAARGQLNAAQDNLARLRGEFARAEAYLELVPKVKTALERLSSQMFDETVHLLENKLSMALRDILRQDIQLKVEPSYHGSQGSTLHFSIQRQGQTEDLMRGQGGSVINILSTGLRLFVLRQLGEDHRPVLFLDEPDAWLHPDLVPRLVRMIKAAATELGYQVILISHHNVEYFQDAADLIYEFVPQADGSVVARESYRREGVERPILEEPQGPEEPVGGLFDL